MKELVQKMNQTAEDGYKDLFQQFEKDMMELRLIKREAVKYADEGISNHKLLLDTLQARKKDG